SVFRRWEPPAASDYEAWATSSDGRSTALAGSDISRYPVQRSSGKHLAYAEWLAKHLPPMRLEISVSPALCVRTHRFRVGDKRLIAFERNIDYHMSEELKQVGGNEAFEKPVDVEASLPRRMHVYDLRTRKYLGHIL